MEGGDIDPSVDRTKDVAIAVDSTGIKVSNRGEWIRQKWAVKRRFIKFHLAVDVKTGKMLSAEVTKGDTLYGWMLHPRSSRHRQEGRREDDKKWGYELRLNFLGDGAYARAYWAEFL